MHLKDRQDACMQQQPTKTANLSPPFLKTTLTRYYRELYYYFTIHSQACYFLSTNSLIPIQHLLDKHFHRQIL